MNIYIYIYIYNEFRNIKILYVFKQAKEDEEENFCLSVSDL